MKLYNLSEIEAREINGGTEESYNLGHQIGEHIGALIEKFKGLF